MSEEDKPGNEDKNKDKDRIVEAIMSDLGLEGESKKRLLAKLVEQYDYDEAKVRYRAKRVFITERYKRKSTDIR
ncbi:MAG: hypothetical protein C4B56_05500 [Candidatus Methanophagaceae archaeon]|nr:MAG: hypothetical protein C4B56_05500 [Methanophagales archaeon]